MTGLLLAIVVSWQGFFLHNVADLPGQTLLSPETAGPTVVYLILTAAIFTRARRAATWGLLGWAALQFLGGAVLSVLPLPVLPYDPAQTLHHYSFHVIYGLSQLPLLAVLLRAVRVEPTRQRRGELGRNLE